MNDNSDIDCLQTGKIAVALAVILIVLSILIFIVISSDMRTIKENQYVYVAQQSKHEQEIKNLKDRMGTLKDYILRDIHHKIYKEPTPLKFKD